MKSMKTRAAGTPTRKERQLAPVLSRIDRLAKLGCKVIIPAEFASKEGA